MVVAESFLPKGNDPPPLLERWIVTLGWQRYCVRKVFKLL
jgi:hypothetical protein